jgi:hypothetical protein
MGDSVAEATRKQGLKNRYSSGFQIQRNRIGKPTKPTG